MARYDYESDITFAQQQFDKAQERGEKRGKRMAREALKTQFVGGLIGAGIKGVKSLLDQKADALHFSQAPQRARYEQMLNQRTSIQNTLKPYIAQGGNKEDYLTDYYYDIYKTEAAKSKPNVEEGSYDAWLREEAGKKAKSMIPVFDKMQQESLDVPTFEEFQAQYTKYSNQVTPRSLGGAAVKYVKNLFDKETYETLAYKNEKAKDVLYGTSLFKESKELKGAIQEWNAAGNGVVDIVKALNEKVKNGELNYKIKKSEFNKVKVPVKGGTQEVTQFVAQFEKEDGSVGFLVEPISSGNFTPEKKVTYTQNDLNMGWSDTETVLKDFGDKNLIKIKDNLKKENIHLSFANSVLVTSKFLQDEYGFNKSEANQRAALFLTEQSRQMEGQTSLLKESMTDYDLLFQDIFMKDKKIEDLNYNEINQIFNSLPNVVNRNEESLNGENYEILVTKINTNNKLSLDEKIEQTQNLNKIFSQSLDVPIDNNIKVLLVEKERLEKKEEEKKEQERYYTAPDGTMFKDGKIIYRTPFGRT